VQLLARIAICWDLLEKSGRPGSNRQHSAWKAMGTARKVRNHKDLRRVVRSLVPALVPTLRRLRARRVAEGKTRSP